MTARRLLPPEAVFFLALLAAGLGVFRVKAFRDPGALWHLRVGELILADGFPRTDPFTFTHAGVPWVPKDWLAEVVLAVAHRLAGLDGPLLLLCAGVSGLYTLQFARLRQAGMRGPLAAAVCGACLFVASFHFYARPHVCTVAGVGLLVGLLLDVDAGRRSLRTLWWLPPAFALWANLHGGVLGGLGTLGLAVAGWLLTAAVRGWKASPVRSWRDVGLVAGVLAGCLLAPLVNPFGPELVRTWLSIVGSDVLKGAIREHGPLDPAGPADQLLLLLAAGYILLLVGAWPRLRAAWLLPLPWFVYTLTSIRQGPLFAVAVAFVLPAVWPHTVWHRLLLRHGDSLVGPPADPPGRPAWLVPAAVVLVLGGLLRGWARLPADELPLEWTHPIAAEAATTGPDRAVYNDANFGGYLLYTRPGRKIFMDDRFELYGDAWTREYVEAIWHRPERFDAWDARWRFGLALVATADRPTPLDRHLAGQPGWREVARRPNAVLYRRVP